MFDAIAGAVARIQPRRIEEHRRDHAAHLATRWVLDSVITSVVEAVGRRVSTADGLESVWHVVCDAPIVSTDLSRPDVRHQLTDWLLGSERTRVEAFLASDAGIDDDSLRSLLESVVGVYLTHLRRRSALEHLDRRGLRKVVLEERRQATSGLDVDLTGD